MKMNQFVRLYLVSLPIFLTLDAFWLGLVASNFYRSEIGPILEFDWLAALVFYLVFLVGLTIFATLPGIVNKDWQSGFVLGALFGFFTYATYDLTNLATLQNWSLKLVVVDVVWGTFICAATAGLTSIVVTNYFRYENS